MTSRVRCGGGTGAIRCFAPTQRNPAVDAADTYIYATVILHSKSEVRRNGHVQRAERHRAPGTLLGSEALVVRYATGALADDMSDDNNDNGGDDSDMST